MEQELIRRRLKKLINDRGSTLTFICKKVALPVNVLSCFKRGKKDLYPESLQALDFFLKKEGY